MGSGQSFRRRPTGRTRLPATSGPIRIGTVSSGCSTVSNSSVALRPDTIRPENPSQHSLPWPPQRYGCHTLSTGPRIRSVGNSRSIVIAVCEFSVAHEAPCQWYMITAKHYSDLQLSRADEKINLL
ncbi:hypothetical protein AGR3A_pa10004 [Agrobacterium tomkonis CFBP 6623]|uniref:Uncharacterized protein n=1 Tax=Agrobacterium tomkonis CFBP 6623 TaxID=1183432 RepID=A0A1S7S7S8_9HYPH|nr:hypothetical protein AGR3A_pa10004 [Agrobacterium tomkonis CFBP 6623]